jgi:hypothetical protein
MMLMHDDAYDHILVAFNIRDVTCGTMWDDPVDYEALLASLTQLGNPKACFFTRTNLIHGKP